MKQNQQNEEGKEDMEREVSGTVQWIEMKCLGSWNWVASQFFRLIQLDLQKQAAGQSQSLTQI